MSQQQDVSELVRPKGLEIDRESLTDSYGCFSAEPLEKGYGVTLGNSLRRILLSSLPGAAVTAVHIEGMKHEYTSLPYAREDGTEIVLNLKQVVVKLQEGLRRVVTIHKTGPCQVLASDIKSPGVAVLNPNQYICTIAEGGEFRADITIAVGRGYVPSTEFEEDDAPLGTIFVDASFSPVRRVNYNVTNARVGQKTDYDKLSLEIWTDGSIAPQAALEKAARIHADQLSVFVNAAAQDTINLLQGESRQADLNEHLMRPVSELKLSVRSAHCLANAGVNRVGDLVQRTEGEMMKTKNFGRKSLKEIKETLEQMGLSLGMHLADWSADDAKESNKS